jgi:hypothetical protein
MVRIGFGLGLDRFDMRLDRFGMVCIGLYRFGIGLDKFSISV